MQLQKEQLLTGVLVQNDFKLSLMAPDDLREYAGLTTTVVTCRQKVPMSVAGVGLVRWSLEGMFGAVVNPSVELTFLFLVTLYVSSTYQMSLSLYYMGFWCGSEDKSRSLSVSGLNASYRR